MTVYYSKHKLGPNVHAQEVWLSKWRTEIYLQLSLIPSHPHDTLSE